jgi:hypothetical protein
LPGSSLQFFCFISKSASENQIVKNISSGKMLSCMKIYLLVLLPERDDYWIIEEKLAEIV